MPPRRRNPAAESLTAENLAALAAAVAEGRRATVYLREGTPSLGLPPGSSARVVSVAQGTVVVRPRGVDDELPYEAEELRMTKNPPPPPEKPARAPRAKKPASAPVAVKVTEPVSKGRPQSARKTAAVKSVTVTLYGSPDNQWSVALTRGGHKPQRSRAVSSEVAEAAAAALGDEPVTSAVTTLLHAARAQAEQRVAELQRELAAAQAALADLDK